MSVRCGRVLTRSFFFSLQHMIADVVAIIGTMVRKSYAL